MKKANRNRVPSILGLMLVLFTMALLNLSSAKLSSQASTNLLPRELQSLDEKMILNLVFEDTFAEYDLNKDGELSVAEELLLQKNRFKHLDSNSNQLLEQQELNNFFSTLIREKLKLILNDNGEQSAVDMMQSTFFTFMLSGLANKMIKQAFDDFDRDEDEGLSFEEFSDLYTRVDQGELDHYLEDLF